MLVTYAYAMEQLSDPELENVVGASIIDPPMLAQQAGGHATMFNEPVALTQQVAEDVQTLTRPGTLANKIVGDTQVVVSPATDFQSVSSGLGF